MKETDLPPTAGLQVENFRLDQLRGIKCTMWDMSGSGKYRNLWEHYYKDCNGVIFVIDSADEKRLTEVRDEISQMINHDHMGKNGVPVLFFANKADLKNARPEKELKEILGLQKIKDHSW
eukprot:CAMPEP_0170189212 /NCGR_PEP_ID=MMETSP0040_2-20121228/46265_1 /TAXON_ID=641309 /ORGANISM="Lotharella oceanica, Strain CCMP622" /LENGTH=119 /DNA_ID=CAMNT_0010436709 /DNA_START=1 /DNA_END=357 /DNA_ORIENTATION=-